ncbi:MAG TPA: hypothetical protein DHV48_04765 [Prolixibacteraceae bacterium]|nr:hypothetical protein [Prolixibacteraceae bacterium]
MNNNLNREWWNNLNKIWKVELIQNLLDSTKYKKRNLILTDIYELLEDSDEIITDILNIGKLDILSDVIYDLSPLSNLDRIIDFHLQLPRWEEVDALFLDLYPEHLRSKARRLDIDGLMFEDDLSPLIKFVNLEVLNCPDCQIESLEGIQNLTRLKVFTGQNNFFSDLNPLRGLNLVSLNIQFTKVTNISPLIDLLSLEWINLGHLSINDFTPLLKLPNLKSVVLPNMAEIPMDELEQYLSDYHNVAENNGQSQSIPELFDYNKPWYLIPFDPFDEFVGSLHEGRIIDNESDFKARNYKHTISCIRITDSINICRELSKPIIGQVKVDKDVRLKLEKKNGLFWYASKVEIHKLVSCWDFLTNVEVFNGDIGISDQPFIPEGLILPKLLKGDLHFGECLLPKKIKFPEVIQGTLIISYSIIPHEWYNIFPLEVGNLKIGATKLEKGIVLPKKVYGNIDFRKLTVFEEGVVMPDSYLSVTAESVDFPPDFKLLNAKLKTLTFEECKLPENFEIPEALYISMIFTGKTISGGLKFPAKYTGILTFEISEIPSGFRLSKIFDGHLVFKNMTLPEDLKLPEELVGILEFRNVLIPDGFELPLKIIGTLKISDIKIKGCLKLPSNNDYYFELDNRDALSDLNIPDSVLPKLKRMPAWHFDD